LDRHSPHFSTAVHTTDVNVPEHVIGDAPKETDDGVMLGVVHYEGWGRCRSTGGWSRRSSGVLVVGTLVWRRWPLATRGGTSNTNKGPGCPARDTGWPAGGVIGRPSIVKKHRIMGLALGKCIKKDERQDMDVV
jgi:hypothetical protein